jgi:hypothetical protein
MTKRWRNLRSVFEAPQVNTSGTASTSQPGLGQTTVATGITAHAGGGQASATQLTARINEVTTVATAADSVKLPVATPGETVTAINTTATAMQVFGTTPDTINGVATGTGVSVPAGKTADFVCATAGAWRMQLGA